MEEVKNMSGLKPLGRAVLVKPYDVEQVSKGGIILADPTVRREQLAEQKAVVIEVGPVAWHNEPMPRAKPGDKILFSKWAGYQATGTADGQTYRIVNDADIFTAITEEKVEE